MNEEQDKFVDNTIDERDELMNFAGNRQILTQPSDPEVKGLWDKKRRGRLDVQPDFQRHFVWDLKTCSRLIESALLRVPLPAIYLSEEKDGSTAVIDGQQRLTAFFDFIKDDGYKLTGLEVLKELNGKKYSDLGEEEQDKISGCSLRVITFLKDSHPDLKFEIFQRLNSGSISLNSQEMRNCMYRGSYNQLLRELSENAEYQKIIGLTERHKRMWDVESALRFAAFYFNGYLDYKPPMKKFLNDEMAKRQEIPEADKERLKTAFKNAVASVFTVFMDAPGETAFRRWLIDTTTNEFRREPKQFSASIFDILMWSFAREDRNALTRNADAIRESMIHLSTSNSNFIDFITRATSSKKAVVGRFDIWRKCLDEILSQENKQPRCFTRVLKEELYSNNRTCAICNNQISHIDDSAVDHIEQYWLGGKTIPENARLTHRHCNNTRPRRE